MGNAVTKLTETQTTILSAGAKRPDKIAMPRPTGLAGAAAKMAVTKILLWLPPMVQELSSRLRP